MNRVIVEGSVDVEETRLMASLPPEYKTDLTYAIKEELKDRPKEIVVYLDDDGIGIQKSHDVYLIIDNSEEGIRSGIQAVRNAGHKLVFILTNCRALPAKEAESILSEIAQTLVRIGREEGLVFKIGIRGDSTLRSHFPLEHLVLMRNLEPFMGKFDGIIVTYFFLTEMSRITVDGVQLLRIRKDDGSYWYRPVHLTDFSKDKRFGYFTSKMAEYVEYKFSTVGLENVKAEDVLYISLKDIRTGGPEAVSRKLLQADKGRVIIVDLVSFRDLQVFVLGILVAERKGKNFIYCSAASLAAARVGMNDIPVLTGNDILGTGRSSGNILCIWGSIVELSNIQLEAVLKKVPNLTRLQLDVKSVLENDKGKNIIVDFLVRSVDQAFREGRNAIVYTYPREIYPPEKQSDMARASNEQRIVLALQEVYDKVKMRPLVVIFKGGTTSSTGLFRSGIKRVYVLGQISPGIPIVKILPKDNEKFPGEEMFIIMGPGNVGVSETYVEMFRKLTENR